MPITFTSNPTPSLSITGNARARFSSVVALNWDSLVDVPAAVSGLDGLSPGLVARISAEAAVAARTLQAPAAGFTITNPAGDAGDPTFSLANDLAGVEGLADTGLVRRTAADTWSAGTTVSTAEIGDDQVTYAKIQNVAQGVILGRASAAGSGDMTELTDVQVKTILNYPSSTTDNRLLKTSGVQGNLAQTGITVDDSENISGGTWQGTAVAATFGGTGQTVYAVGDILYASTTTALSKLADVATGNALISGGVGVAPLWGKVGLTTHVSGTLAVTNGGLGIATVAQGDILYGSASNTITALTKNASATRYLANTGTSNNPNWDQVAMTTGVSDYAEGSWTPVIQGSSTPGAQTYSVQVGRYVRIGNIVFVSARLTMTAKDGTTAGNVQIGGLPFTSRNVTNLIPAMNVALYSNIDLDVAGSRYSISALVAENSTIISLLEVGDNVSSAALTAADIGNTTAIAFSGWYIIN
jgi:hypothetical protein